MFNKRFAGLMLMGAALTVSSAAFAAGDRDFNTAAGAVIGAAIGNHNGGTGGAVVGGLVGAAVGNSLSGGGRHNRGYVGTGGVVNMSAQDHMGLDLSAFRMLEVRGGDWNLVEPRH